MTCPTCRRCKRTGLPSLITDNPSRFNEHCVDCAREIEREEEAYWDRRDYLEWFDEQMCE